MASRSGDQVDLAAGLGRRPVKDQFAPGVPVDPVSEDAASEDTMLVSDARNGNRLAFGRLYVRYARMVHGVLLAKVPVSEVDDLVQDVFLVALRRLSMLRETGSFGPWLAAAAKRLHHNVLATAVANKLARIAWTVLVQARSYETRVTSEMA